MPRPIALLVGLLITFAPVVAHAQPWSGILSPSRAVEWSNAGVPGGITNRTTICATLNPGATAAQIESAINACPSGQVVFLNAGTFALSAGLEITKSNVTLRGAGADKTKLTWNRDVGSGCFFTNGPSLCLMSGENNWGGNGGLHSANWTAGYAKGTTVITLSNTTGLAVGSQLFLDQLDDTVDGWPSTGDIVVNTTTNFTGEGGNSHGRQDRSQVQVVRVTAINGLNVTISPGLYMPNWRASQNPGAWWGNRVLTGVGIENLTIDIGGNGGRPGIMMFNVRDSWIKGIRQIVPAATGSGNQFQHVSLANVDHVTIRDSYFYGVFASTGGITQYGITAELVSDLLVENNIVDAVAGCLEHNGQDQGSVWSYNFTRDAQGVNAFADHNVGNSMVLYEGNSGSGVWADIVHGTRNFMTHFRNHFYGNNGQAGLEWIQAYNRFFNIVGNVLGASSFNTYETTGLAGQRGTEIFSLNSRRSSSYNFPDDPRVKATLMRWGNYDTVTGTARFLPAEVPSDITNFANPIPASQALPPSFYLSARPSWWATRWGTPAWPPVGPDVTGGNISGYAGHAWKIPARLCYENTPIDSAYGSGNIRLFDPTTCYGAGSGSVPSAPTNPILQ